MFRCVQSSSRVIGCISKSSTRNFSASSSRKNVFAKPLVFASLLGTATATVGLVSYSQQKEVDPYFDLILDEDLKNNSYPCLKMAKAKSADHTSLMAQIMTPELFEKYKDHKTATAGWTIARAINTGVMYPSSFVGCHAGDLESWDDFKDLFYPVVEAYHKGFNMETSSHVTDMDVNKITEDLTDSAKSKIISTRIRVARNLAAFPLNPGGDLQQRLDVMAMVKNVCNTFEGDLAGKVYEHTKMTPAETKQLVDDHFLFRGKDKMQAASGYHEFWPEGRGIFHNNAKTFLLWVNEGDHIRIISMEMGGDVKRVFARLAAGVAAVEKGVQQVTNSKDAFMMHPKLGCITCCPSNLGTGMRGGVHVKVPHLIEAIGFDGIDKLCRQRDCQARGSSGEHSEVVDRIDVSNWRRLGFPEWQLCQDMISCVNFLVELEDLLAAKKK